MSRIVLISCTSKKLGHPAPAGLLYISPLFRKQLAYAHTLKPKAIYILSAKYGLLDLKKRTPPYNQTLSTMSAAEVRGWATRVAGQMQGKIDFEKDEIVFLAGERYRKHLLPLFRHARVPLEGLGIGKQLQYLTKRT